MKGNAGVYFYVALFFFFFSFYNYHYCLMLMIGVLDWILYYCKYAIDGWGIYVMVHRALVLSLKW